MLVFGLALVFVGLFGTAYIGLENAILGNKNGPCPGEVRQGPSLTDRLAVYSP